MGTLAASVPINRALTTLLDDIAPAPNTHYSAAELLDYCNASIRLACLYKPDLYVIKDDAFALTAGARQSLGTTGHTFIRSPGNRQVDFDDMDHSMPRWTAATAGVTEIVIPDKDFPDTFWVYPPANNGATIPVVYGAAPPVLGSAAATLPLGDDVEPVIYFLILAHAYAKNYKLGDIVKMNNYLQQATNALGLKLRIQLQTSPQGAAMENRLEGNG